MSFDDVDDFRKRLSAIANDEAVPEIESKVFLDIYQIEECAYRTAQIAGDTSAFLEKLTSK